MALNCSHSSSVGNTQLGGPHPLLLEFWDRGQNRRLANALAASRSGIMKSAGHGKFLFTLSVALMPLNARS